MNIPASKRLRLHVVVLNTPRVVGLGAVDDDAESPGVGHVDVGVLALVVPGVDDQVAEKTALEDGALGQNVTDDDLVGVQVKGQQLGRALLDTSFSNFNLAGIKNPQTAASMIDLKGKINLIV